MFLKRYKAGRIHGFIYLALAFLILIPPLSGAANGEKQWVFSSLKKKLVADGFDPATVTRIYASPEVRFSDQSISRYFTYREGRLNYQQFTATESIEKANDYLEHHKDKLTWAEDQFGVDKEVIIAIMLVETKLGTFLGNSNVLNILSTMASLENHANRDLLWRKQLINKKISRKQFDAKALRKAKWAYTELKAFLSYTGKQNTDPASVTGSFAGAIGIAQFMPSNILFLGQDGDGNGSIDLFTHADAIASIANYLKYYGWKPGISRDKAYKVVYHYNHSKYYVNTVLKISELLKG